MRIEPLGDAAYIVRDLGLAPAFVLAGALESLNLPGVQEVNAAYDTLGVFVDPLEFSLPELRAALEDVPISQQPVVGKSHTVPVCYELGEDLETSAEELGLSVEEFVAHHSSVGYTCFAVGFSHGFPYLGPLPEALRGLARLPVPRLLVPDGAVAVTGDQAGIYPGGRPGGWRLIGVTPLQIVSLRDEYFPITAGDTVSFKSVPLSEFNALKGERL